jgi:hypothetical protein
MRRIAALTMIVCVGVLTPARADEPDEDIPIKGQPREDFYNAKGIGVKVIATATPTEIARGEWLNFRLTVVNLLNASDVKKPSLKALPAFSSFQIDEGEELDTKNDPTMRERRVFNYRLRPHSETTTLIPEIKFNYFDPQRKVPESQPQLRFPRTFSNAVVILVKPPVEPPAAPPIPLDIPAFATELTTGKDALTIPSGNPPVLVWLIGLLLPPMLAISWVIVWRRLYPDAAKLVLLKRNRAVRRALAAIVKAKELPPERVADAIATAVLNYLRERFELPPGAFTPSEIAAHLRSSGCPAERIALVETLFHDCDNRRFAPTQVHSEMAVDAEQLIIALEEPA